MEQRRGRRRAADFHAVLRYEALGLISGRARDIGRGGMALAALPVTVPANVPVRLHFQLPRGEGDVASYDVAATVAWARNGEMGIMFCEQPPDLNSALGALLGEGNGRRFGFRKRFHG